MAFSMHRPPAGKYRKFPKCVDNLGNANAWQIADMPIKASECDQWYKDCYDDFFCACLEVLFATWVVCVCVNRLCVCACSDCRALGGSPSCWNVVPLLQMCCEVLPTYVLKIHTYMHNTRSTGYLCMCHMLHASRANVARAFPLVPFSR